jgi:phage tail sheath protein FI
MPEILHPGVFVEEVATGIKPIEGVATGTAAFVGETARGPLRPARVRSYREYREKFGGEAGAGKFMPAAVNGFFENGGRCLYVCRVVGAKKGRGDAAKVEVADFEKSLSALEKPAFRDVALVYAPGASYAVANAIVAHCERLRYRFAVVDGEKGLDAKTFQPRAAVAKTDYAAIYHPWIVVRDPQSGTRRSVPPGGHVAGIYARTDEERGVCKAPANAVLRGALKLTADIDGRLQQGLVSRGINPIRQFADRGIRVWGARTLSTDGSWKYVNVRRLLIFLEHSIDEGTQWTVFEPNDERLWKHLSDTIRNFLGSQWRLGRLAGQRERDAFFVRCDRTTMTEDDINNGRLICLVGVAPLRPAEFIVVRLGRFTAEANR